MNEINYMTVTIKLSAEDVQAICEIAKSIKKTDKNNEDTILLGINEKSVIKSVFSKITSAAKRKADKLEALSSEFKNSIEFDSIN